MTSGHPRHQGRTCMLLLQRRASYCLMVQLRGHKVCIVEKRRVEGRLQEWNVSRSELQVGQLNWESYVETPIICNVMGSSAMCGLLLQLACQQYRYQVVSGVNARQLIKFI